MMMSFVILLELYRNMYLMLPSISGRRLCCFSEFYDFGKSTVFIVENINK